MTHTNKSYKVPEWFLINNIDKIGPDFALSDVFAIIKETPKAVYAMLNLGVMKRRCLWIPKSVLIEREVGEQEDGQMFYETIKEEDYDECVKLFKEHWDKFM